MQRYTSFEEEVRLLMEAFGYEAVTTPPSGDHGVDIIGIKNGRKVAVQVKLFGKSRVGNQAVLMLVGGMRVYGATESLLIATGRFTRKAREACEATGVVWYDRDRLLKLCHDMAITLPSWCGVRHEATGHTHRTETELIVGRDFAVGMSVSVDMTISRRHCAFQRRGLALLVCDLGSANGTWLNGTRLTGKARLRYGDVIVTGQQRWLVVPE